MTIFYCVQIEKSAHGRILSCEATNGGEADTSQKVSRKYRLRSPALHMDHWSCLRNFAKFYRVQRIPLPSPCWKHLVITISQLRIYEDTMLWALSTRREGLYRGSPGIVILWNVPLTPLVNMLQPDNLFAYQCRPPPTSHPAPNTNHQDTFFRCVLCCSWKTLFYSSDLCRIYQNDKTCLGLLFTFSIFNFTRVLSTECPVRLLSSAEGEGNSISVSTSVHLQHHLCPLTCATLLSAN